MHPTSLYKRRAQDTCRQKVTQIQAQTTRSRFAAVPASRPLLFCSNCTGSSAGLLTSAKIFFAQRQPESPGSQPIRDYKGQSRQMITMAFLEEGGYFDVPIQVTHMLQLLIMTFTLNGTTPVRCRQRSRTCTKAMSRVSTGPMMWLAGCFGQARLGCDNSKEGVPCQQHEAMALPQTEQPGSSH